MLLNKTFSVVLIQELCKGCYICVEMCPREVFSVEEAPGPGGFKPVRAERPENCNGCRLCVIYCPDFATEVSELAPQEA